MQAKILALILSGLGQNLILSILAGLLEKLRPVAETTATELDNRVLDCLIATLHEHAKTPKG